MTAKKHKRCSKCGRWKRRSSKQIAQLKAVHKLPRSKKQKEQVKRMHIVNTGRHRTAEACSHMSAAWWASSKHVEHLKAMQAANVGKRRPAENYPRMKAHLEKVHTANTGRKQSPETCEKKSVSKTGDKNPNWMGGISNAPYAWTFNAELKEEVRRRDGYKCQKCGAPQAESKTALPVHHIDYCKTNSDPVNLITLCVSCNAVVNKNREHWMAFFQAIATKRDIEGRCSNG